MAVHNDGYESGVSEEILTGGEETDLSDVNLKNTPSRGRCNVTRAKHFYGKGKKNHIAIHTLPINDVSAERRSRSRQRQSRESFSSSPSPLGLQNIESVSTPVRRSRQKVRNSCVASPIQSSHAPINYSENSFSTPRQRGRHPGSHRQSGNHTPCQSENRTPHQPENCTPENHIPRQSGSHTPHQACQTQSDNTSFIDGVTSGNSFSLDTEISPNVANVLGDLTNALKQVVHRLDKQESRLASMEKKMVSSSPSGSSSGSSKKPKVPLSVRVCFV